MAKYRCAVCGYVFEETEDKKFSDLTKCPVCGQPVSQFEPVEEPAEEEKGPAAEENPLAYPKEYFRRDDTCRYMAEIQTMAQTGKPIIDAMGTKMKMPGWDDILIWEIS